MAWPLDRFTDEGLCYFSTERHGSGNEASGCPACQDYSGSFVGQAFSFAQQPPIGPQMTSTPSSSLYLRQGTCRFRRTGISFFFTPCYILNSQHSVKYVTPWPVSISGRNIWIRDQTQLLNLCTRIWLLERQGPRSRMTMERNKVFLKTYVKVFLR